METVEGKKFVRQPKELFGFPVIQQESDLVNALTQGLTVARFEFGDSLSPIINSGEYCILKPISENDEIKVGDVIFGLVRSFGGNYAYMTHMVLNISDSGYGKTKWYQIGSSWGDIFGWTNQILAKAEGTNVFEKAEKY